MSEKTDLPNELPANPVGWTRKMKLHINFGEGKKGGGLGNYDIFDAEGNKTPIGYQYDTRIGGLTGFYLPDIPEPMSWKALRSEWPRFLQRRLADGNSHNETEAEAAKP